MQNPSGENNGHTFELTPLYLGLDIAHKHPKTPVLGVKVWKIP